MIKKTLKPLITFALARAARAVVRRYRPKIVMVTGSVGKTSTKDAVAAALSGHFFLAASEKSFNSEFGVPFTILGVGNPWKNPFAWAKVAKAALGLLVLPNHYPKLLVLEVGADNPGDMARVLSIATPDLVVVTGLTRIPVHVEAYESPEAVRQEEFSPALALSPGAPLIVPADDPFAVDLALGTVARVFTYGTEENAAVRVSECGFYKEGEAARVTGMRACVRFGSTEKEVVIRGSVGKTQVYPLAAAVATALSLGMSLAEAVAGIEKGYVPPPGRGRLLEGEKDTLIIDDSYNASPAAVEAALRNLAEFPRTIGRRIAVLGDMLELGRYSVSEHERIGVLARDVADIVFAVGIRARAFGRADGRAEVRLFDTSRSAAEALREFIEPGDVILVKGSQSIRTERIVEALLKDKSDRARLVRQERAWKRR